MWSCVKSAFDSHTAPFALILGIHKLKGITTMDYTGHRCLQLRNAHGTAIISLHGAQLLSWVPAGQSDVFWLSPEALPEPAAIRGGVPVCWPWFASQGMPMGAMSHGPVRNRLWEVATTTFDDSDDSAVADQPVRVTLKPTPGLTPDDPMCRYAPGLQVSLRVELGDTLTQTLTTCNLGEQPFTLTQALHSYFAVSDARQVQISGLENRPYVCKLTGAHDAVHSDIWQLDQACDRVYQQGTASVEHHYTLTDPAGRRQIHITTQGSQSVVVWNPGAATAAKMVDIPNDGWHQFVCIEAANAGADCITLVPGDQHSLTQILALTHE
jgi:glucose-6-phosphate 1-epimerase